MTKIRGPVKQGPVFFSQDLQELGLRLSITHIALFFWGLFIKSELTTSILTRIVLDRHEPVEGFLYITCTRRGR